MTSSSGSERTAIAILACVVMAVIACGGVASVDAATFIVNSAMDQPDAAPGNGVCATSAGSCTLRAAVMESNASVSRDTIEVPSGLYQLTLPMNAGGGHLGITDGVRIQGAGAATTIIEGNHTDTVIYVKSGDVVLNNVTVKGGKSQFGGGIKIDQDETELNNVVIRDNEAFTGGGGLRTGDDATVRMRRSTVSNNTVTGAFGGGILNRGLLFVDESTIANNISNRAGGAYNQGRLILRNTTVSGNVAVSPDAGTGGISQNGYAVLYNVTVTDNTGVGNNAASFRGGGIQTTSGNTTLVKNSIIAGNHGGAGPNDCVGSLTLDSKYSLIGDTNGCVIPAYVSTFRLNVVPQLGSLADNGGTTQTHLLAATSPALEAASPGNYPADRCESHDQRGVPRPQGGGICDMGAVELTNANMFVTGFVLVDAAANTDIRPLLHGDRLVLSELPPELSIRAQITGAAGSVVFGYDGAPAFQTENVSPYALAGDAPAGDYSPVALSVGTHNLTATPFDGMAGGGAAGGSQTISFTVSNPPSANEVPPSAPKSLNVR